MFNNMLIALLLVATIDIPWAESALGRDLVLNRKRRANDEKKNSVTFGSINKHYLNNYYLDDNGQGSGNLSIVAGSETNQDKNSYSNIGQAAKVYIVLPHWYKIPNQQTPSAVHRSLGTQVTPQRRQVVQEKIEELKRTCSQIHEGVEQLIKRNSLSFDSISVASTLEQSNKSAKLFLLKEKCDSLKARLKYQEVRLGHFSDETLLMQDIFDADLAHLRTILEIANLELLSLQASENN